MLSTEDTAKVLGRLHALQHLLSQTAYVALLTRPDPAKALDGMRTQFGATASRLDVPLPGYQDAFVETGTEVLTTLAHALGLKDLPGLAASDSEP